MLAGEQGCTAVWPRVVAACRGPATAGCRSFQDGTASGHRPARRWLVGDVSHLVCAAGWDWQRLPAVVPSREPRSNPLSCATPTAGGSTVARQGLPARAAHPWPVSSAHAHWCTLSFFRLSLPFLSGGGMAGYQQQDAHEFFCFVLEMMGATTPGAGAPPRRRRAAPGSQRRWPGPCCAAALWCRQLALTQRRRRLWAAQVPGKRALGPEHTSHAALPALPARWLLCAGPLTPFAADCITHSVFGGTLRSDVICSACGHTSTSHEQFSHLSLDMPPPQQVGGVAAGQVPGVAVQWWWACSRSGTCRAGYVATPSRHRGYGRNGGATRALTASMGARLAATSWVGRAPSLQPSVPAGSMPGRCVTAAISPHTAPLRS